MRVASGDPILYSKANSSSYFSIDFERRATCVHFFYKFRTMDTDRIKFLKLLSKEYPNSIAAGMEVVIQKSILELPKGSEIFLSDVHGEHESFGHVLKNGSGLVRSEIELLFKNELSADEIRSLAVLIYYPAEKLDIIRRQGKNTPAFYETTLDRFVKIGRSLSAVYSLRKIQYILPESHGPIILELLQKVEHTSGKHQYYRSIIDTVIQLDQADQLLISFAKLIQRLAVHRIHIIGDIFDRGPGADIILDSLIEHHSVDVQWGNHDIVWMGAACGSEACIANVLRLSLRYANTDTLEKGYGINLIPLASFALQQYKNDKSIAFEPKLTPDQNLSESERWLNKLMHKAISVIQFKLEEQLIQRRPEFNLGERLFLDKIDRKKGVLVLHGKEYSLTDTYLPTLNKQSPTALSREEAALMQTLKKSFTESKRLRAHVQFLYEVGGLYKVTNSNLLYHGCIPLSPDGSFQEVSFHGQGTFKGRALLDFLERTAREAFFGDRRSERHSFAEDMMWYLWSGPQSPLFGKDKMATFERYFTDDDSLKAEKKSAYYKYRDDEKTCRMILSEFGLDPDRGLIVNGHVPVVVKRGESPLKANGKLLVIDGGFAKAYQTYTGIAGYSLIYDKTGLKLVAHSPFESTEKAIEEELDIASSKTILRKSKKTLRVRDLDDCHVIHDRIADLEELIRCYQSGQIKEIR